MVKFKLAILLFVLAPIVLAQDNPLEQYIHIGLQSNLALKQQNFALDHSVQVLNEARGKYFPSISIEARYSRAGGGREISVPIGDFINPVYRTLNQLLIAEGFPSSFPENIPNETIPFMREKEQDTRIRVVQPLIQPAIWYNYDLKSDLNEIEELRTTIYKRQLVNEIKRAYFNYLKAVKIVELYIKIQELQSENLRVSEKLFSAGKATQEVIFRAKAELSETEQEKMHFINVQNQGRSYLNFILNRPLKTEIIKTTNPIVQDPTAFNCESAIQSALLNREELDLLKHSISATNNNAGIIRSKFFPGINAVLDYGFQGVEYDFSKNNDYWMASVILEWNLFNGFQDKAKLEQISLEAKTLLTREEELEKQIELEVKRVYDDLMISRKSIDVAEQRFKSSQASFNIISKKYEEGVAAQIEYLDAQTNLTRASINEAISEYDFYITYADFERYVALYKF